MFEKWRAARSSRGGDSAGPEESAAPVAPATASGDAWRALPPVQRVLDGGPRTIAEYGFSSFLATHWNPSFQSDLGHGAVPDAPGGVMLDAVRAVPAPVPVQKSAAPSRPAELPGLRLPVAASGTGTGPGPGPGPGTEAGAGAAVASSPASPRAVAGRCPRVRVLVPRRRRPSSVWPRQRTVGAGTPLARSGPSPALSLGVRPRPLRYEVTARRP